MIKTGKSVVAGSISAILIVLSVVLIIMSSFFYSSFFIKAAEETGYLPEMSRSLPSGPVAGAPETGRPVQKQKLDIAAGLKKSLEFILSLWWLYLIFGKLGAVCALFKLRDNKKEPFRVLYTYSVTRTYLWWFTVIFVACHVFILVKLRSDLVFYTLFPREVHVYSYWMLLIASAAVSFIGALACDQMWMFWYRLIMKEKKVDDLIDANYQ